MTSDILRHFGSTSNSNSEVDEQAFVVGAHGTALQTQDMGEWTSAQHMGEWTSAPMETIPFQAGNAEDSPRVC